jgi:hypothetical protein
MAISKALVKGQRLLATVEEVHTGGALLISLNGKLLRVLNTSKKTITVGDRVSLIVKSIAPLQFQFAEDIQGFNRLA